MDPDDEGKKNIFFGKFRIIKRIGCGSFGNVYKGINIIDQKNVAIKVEKKESGYNLLQKESYYLYTLKGIGIPELISYGYSGKYNVLVQTLLGESLGKIFYKKNNYFSLKDICMFTIQILNRIEYVHSKYLIHRDIKPENFLIGDSDKYMIYIIDFGLSKKYRSSRTNKHIQFKLTKKFTGTARYASINAVRGAEQSRRDDLEAIGYMLLFFFTRGKLPWQGVSCKEKAQKYAKIYNMKKHLDYEVFCKNMPKEIITYMNYCKELPFEKEPNYEYLRNLFENVLKRNGFQNDLKFSWITDYSILKNIEEIKNIIAPNNFTKRKQSPQTRIYKKLESSREINKENNIHENSYNKLINNNSLVNIQKDNLIEKANTYTLQYNLGHKRFNSSWDSRGLKRKESEAYKSSIAKYNSSIDDEEPLNNLSNLNNNYFSNVNNIDENNNLNISKNDQLINKNNSKNNLFYFSNNFNDLSKSLALKKNKNENTSSMFIKNDNENTVKINLDIQRIMKSDIDKNNENTKNNNSYHPKILKSFSYVKKFENKIDEIKINFNNSKILSKHTKDNKINNINAKNQLKKNNNVNNPIKNNSFNIIYNKKKGSKTKINNMQKLSINKVINSNNGTKKMMNQNKLNINPVLVNKSRDLDNIKLKIKKAGNNPTRNKKGKIIKPKPKNIINIPISPNNNNYNSYSNIFKKSTFINNSHQNSANYLNQNKVTNSNLKKEQIQMNNLTTNLNNNAEGKINKIKNMHIHSNIRKDSNINYKRINTDIIFKTNTNDITNQNQKRINKYKNVRHKIYTKSGNLTIQKNIINNKGIPKSLRFPKTINSSINNSNNTISNTIQSNNNNNTIISIYNNYNINKNIPRNELLNNIQGINFDLDSLNNNNNTEKHKTKYFSYNRYNLNNFQKYIHLNQRKSPTITSQRKKISIENYPQLIPRIDYKNNDLFRSQTMIRDYSYQEKYPNDNLKNYFSLNGNNLPINEHKISKLMNLSSVRHNLNSLNIKNILTEMKYNVPKDNLNNKNKREKYNIDHVFNIVNRRSNSFILSKRTNFKNLISKPKNTNMDFEYYYPTINRKKTDIFYQKLPAFKMNFDIDDSNLIQDSRNNTPSFKRYGHNRDYFKKYLNENEYISLKY